MKRWITVLISFIIISAQAQDIHFTQYNASPLTLNPANTGIRGCYRVGGNYRNQWRSIPAPYTTYSVGYDKKLADNVLGKDRVGGGILLFNDIAGDGNLGNLSVMLSAAYHKVLDAEKKHRLSFGIQGGLVQRSLDMQKLFFGSQYDGEGGFDQAIDQENVQQESFNYFDFRAGLLWRGKLAEKLGMYSGVAFYHLTTPSETFTNSDNQLDMRTVFHGGANYAVNERLGLLPSFLVMHESKALELSGGASVSYKVNDSPLGPFVAYGGLQYRHQDALIPMLAASYKDYTLGLSYDINISSLQPASMGRGGLELSLVYTNLCTVQLPSDVTVPCPLF